MNSRVEIRRGTYHDSVSLMAVSRAVSETAGVDGALVAMATELNLDLLRQMGFDGEEAAGAGPNDLLVAVCAGDEAALQKGLAAVDRELANAASRRGPSEGLGAEEPAKTIGSAARRARYGLALLSIPGPHVFPEAMDALTAGMNVMIFSDNVPVGQEILLKREAARRGLLVMGPDCGTAIVGGVGLGFANAVRPGPVGIVGASGTGTQQLCCLLDDAGVGITHAIGVGGRDLSAEVGGASTLAALAALDADPATELIAIVSKPPAKQVADRVLQAAGACSTPVVTAFLGRGQPDLTQAAAEVLRALGRDTPEPRWWSAPTERSGPYRVVRGLFAGGTLCDEAMGIAAEALGPIRSNIPLEPEWALPDDLRAPGHLMIDFGDDRLTQGRPHPMIDQTLRLERIAAEAAHPQTGVLLLDVVLGYGAHDDPAGELAPALRAARERAAAGDREIAVVVSLCGARADPQGRDRQAEALVEAGASVHLSNAAAARTAVELLERPQP
jgi:FdrA protein